MSRARPRLKTLLFAAVVNAMGLILLFGVGEFGARWRLEGSAGAAFVSFFAATDGAGDARTWLVYDDALGYKLNPAYEGINRFGIRHADIPVDKPDGLFRVIVLGDSVAWDSAGFVTLLRSRLGSLREGPAEVINAAIPGYTTYQERLLLERDLIAVQPDLVILQYCLNDNHRFLHRLSRSGSWLITPEAERVLDPEGSRLLASLYRSSRLLVDIRLRLLASKYFARTAFPWDSRVDFAPAWQDGTWPAIDEHLRAIRDRVTQIGGRLAVVAVPFEPQLRQDLLDRDRDYTLKPQRRLKEICSRLNVPLLDLHPVFLENRDRRLFRDGTHLAPPGHDLVARRLLTFLESENLTK